MLHLLQVKESEIDKPPRTLDKVAAWGVSFPATKLQGTEVEYVVNTTWWSENFSDDLEESEEEDQVNSNA